MQNNEQTRKLNIKTDYENLVEPYRRGVPTTAFGIPFAMKTRLLGEFSGKILYVVKDFLEGKETVDEFEGFYGFKPSFITEREENLLTVKSSSKELSHKRIQGVIESKHSKVTIITAPALIGLLPKDLPTLTLEKGREYDIDGIIKTLSSFGYKRLALTEGKGSFSVRGDVVDIHPINFENPVRIDFFGDEIERIKEFNQVDGTAINILEKVTVYPASELILTGEEKELKQAVLEEIKNYKGKENLRHKELSEDLITAIETGDALKAQSAYALSKNFAPALLALNFDAVIFSEPRILYDFISALIKEHQERYSLLYKAGETFSFLYNSILTISELLSQIENCKRYSFQALTADIKLYNPLCIINANASNCPKYQGKLDALVDDLKNWAKNGYKVTLYAGDNERAEKLSNTLLDCYVPLENDKIIVTAKYLPTGYIYHDKKEVVIGSADLFLKRKKVLASRKTKAFFSAPEAGDYAVHETHGIGKVIGSKKLTTGYATKDYIAVAYAGGDILYVPAEQIDVLSKYVGGEKEPKLSKIGGKDFDRVKSRVKESLKKLSFDLKKLYEERKAKRGFKYEEDDELRRIFGDACGFEETPDQITADEEIANDMCSNKVMDRLVCGDVGYGKTEVAFRAIFRAIANNKQCALLAPTTILVEQHYDNAVKRFKDFGVKIESLDRFKTKKQQTEILERLNKGDIDLVIGTHRLLSKDVSFKDLGLLVLDEEQRFGVEHKEKIKTLKSNIDALTLTATPIPRTLHMSLSGIRDISTLNTPPKSRLPVQTYVVELTDALLTDAILRETGRGGQVFVLYNRVETIENFTKKLNELVPNVKIKYAHGQMDERTLEKTFKEFYENKFEVLVATTIIENGLDLPNANTLIVTDADKLGLSTLYQLRGRVGRSNRLAHAYFTFRQEKVLTEVAYKRLSAIMEFTEMGSGFKIAMRDLEIRGAGNVLGVEQHGHMDKIGYELYSKLLKAEMDGEEETYLEIDARVSAFIPYDYIESESGRMDAYKEIAEIENEQESAELLERLQDAYGPVPKETVNLIKIAIIKRALIKIGADAFVIDAKEVVIGFKNLSAINDEKLVIAVSKTAGFSFSVSAGVRIKFARNGLSDGDTLDKLLEFLSKTQA